MNILTSSDYPPTTHPLLLFSFLTYLFPLSRAACLFFLTLISPLPTCCLSAALEVMTVFTTPTFYCSDHIPIFTLCAPFSCAHSHSSLSVCSLSPVRYSFPCSLLHFFPIVGRRQDWFLSDKPVFIVEMPSCNTTTWQPTTFERKPFHFFSFFVPLSTPEPFLLSPIVHSLFWCVFDKATFACYFSFFDISCRTHWTELKRHTRRALHLVDMRASHEFQQENHRGKKKSSQKSIKSKNNEKDFNDSYSIRSDFQRVLRGFHWLYPSTPFAVVKVGSTLTKG